MCKNVNMPLETILSPTSHITIKIKESELKFPPRQDEFFRFRVKRLF